LKIWIFLKKFMKTVEEKEEDEGNTTTKCGIGSAL
jgi:hypothetical protein